MASARGTDLKNQTASAANTPRLRPKTLSAAASASAFTTAGKAADTKQSTAFGFSPRAIDRAHAGRTTKFATEKRKAHTPRPSLMHLAPSLARRGSMPNVDTRQHQTAAAAHHKTTRSSGAIVLPLPACQYIALRLQDAVLTPRTVGAASASPNSGDHTPRNSPAILALHDQTPVVHVNPDLIPDDYDPIESGRLTAAAIPAAVHQPQNVLRVKHHDTERDMPPVIIEQHEMVAHEENHTPIAVQAGAAPVNGSPLQSRAVLFALIENPLTAASSNESHPVLVSPTNC